MRSGLNKIVVVIIGLVIFVTGSTAIVTLAQEPGNLPKENIGAITVDIDPAVFQSRFYAENPELMAAHRVTADIVPTQSESQFYAENPELMAAHRVEAGFPVDALTYRWQAMANFYKDAGLLARDAFDYPAQNQLGTQDKAHHPRLLGMQTY